MTVAPDRLLAWLPLLAAYALAPLMVLAGRLSGLAERLEPFGPRGMALWLALAGVALLASLVRGALQRRAEARTAWPGLALGLALGLLLFALWRWLAAQFALPDMSALAPLLDELRLPALALFAAAWTWSFGAPSRTGLARLGAGLGGLALLDFLLTAIMARQVVLGGGLLLGLGPAMSDILGLLLCIALAATLDPPAGKDGGGEAPARPRLARWLILAGLFATFSRPGLAAAAAMLLLLDRGPLGERLGLALGCALGVWMSLTLPLAGGAAHDEGLGLAWHLQATLDALGQRPHGWLTGLPLNEPVALAMPDLFQGNMTGEEWVEAEGLPVAIFEVPSSWLRLAAAWGLWGPLAVLAAALACALRRRRRFGFGLLAALLVSAALTPSLHTPATASALALAFALAWKDAPPPQAAREVPWP